MCSTIKIPETEEEIGDFTAGNHEFIPLGTFLSLSLFLLHHPVRPLSLSSAIFNLS